MRSFEVGDRLDSDRSAGSLWSAQDFGEQVPRGMIFPIADDADGAAELAHHLALGHGGFGVVCAFAVDVGDC